MKLKFKIGDLVKLNSNKLKNDTLQGKTLKIHKIDSNYNERAIYTIKYNSIERRYWSYELEKVTDLSTEMFQIY